MLLHILLEGAVRLLLLPPPLLFKLLVELLGDPLLLSLEVLGQLLLKLLALCLIGLLDVLLLLLDVEDPRRLLPQLELLELLLLIPLLFLVALLQYLLVLLYPTLKLLTEFPPHRPDLHVIITLD